MLHYIWIYICFFFGIFFEGELVFLSALIAASHGYLNIWLVAAIAIIGTITSDLVYFNLGKNRAKKLMKKPKWKSKIELVHKKLEKHRTIFLIGYRFLYGLRVATPLVLGTQNIKLLTFLKYSSISTLIWAILFTTLGLSFGDFIITNLKHIEKIEHYVIGGLLIVALTFFIAKLIKKSYYISEK